MVFISYSHDSDTLCDRVLELSNYLRSQGIDSILDQYEESPSEGWPRWMEKQIKTAEYVIVVCTFPYNRKASLEVHDDTGLGVKWETNIILNQLYNSGTITNKYIPVVFEDEDVNSILEPLKGQTYYNLKYKIKREKLRNRLLGIKTNKKPSLGQIKPKEEKSVQKDARMLVTSVIDVEKWNEAKWKGVGYMFDFIDPPFLGIYHENIEMSKKIFSDWIIRFSKNDVNDEIYISIIESDNCDKYAIHIGIDLVGYKKRLSDEGINDDFDRFMLIDRWHVMDDVNKKYKEQFIKEYEKHGCYYLIPMYQIKGEMVPFTDFAIKKKKISFRNIKEINKIDYDYLALDLLEKEKTKT